MEDGDDDEEETEVEALDCPSLERGIHVENTCAQ
jgi:hypothetical protein